MSHYEESLERPDPGGGLDINFTSALLSIAQEFLYWFPPHAGNVLLEQYARVPDKQKQTEWLRMILNWSTEELIARTSQEGDEEDKMIFLNVFLWKQRHGFIGKTLRIRHDFRHWPDGLYIHRFMVANDYENVLGMPACLNEDQSYLEKIDSLLSAFNRTDFDSEKFWELVMRLNVMGPRLAKYHRRADVLNVAEYVLRNWQQDPRLEEFKNDVRFSNIALLFFDLNMDTHQTWPLFGAALRDSPTHSVACYPALNVGLSMYGDQLRGELRALAIQGGNDLFYSLADQRLAP